MAKYTPETIRNIAILGHSHDGKTTLAEAMLFAAGAIPRMGSTDNGSATLDFEPEEEKHHISISAGIAHLEWTDTKINLIDCPGFADFTTSGYYVQGSYFLIPKKLQAAVQWQDLNPGQRGSDGIHSITGGLNYYIHGDDIKLMVDYIHTWSDFRGAHPEFGEDQFDEVIGRIQLMF